MPHVVWSVCLCVCLCFSHTVCALQKRLNLLRCRLGAESWGLRNHVLDKGQDRTNPITAATGDNSAMRPFAKLLWTLVHKRCALSVDHTTGNTRLNYSFVVHAILPAHCVLRVLIHWQKNKLLSQIFRTAQHQKISRVTNRMITLHISTQFIITVMEFTIKYVNLNIFN